MIGALLVAGLALWSLGAGVDLFAGAERTAFRLIPYTAGLAGSVLVAIAGIRCVLDPIGTLNLGSTLGVGQTSVKLDPLAGMFLTLTASLGVAISACLIGWVRPAGRVKGRGVASGFLLLLGAVTVVIIAGDAFTFLFGWESLSISFYVLTGVSRSDNAQPSSSWLTLGIGKAGGAALMVGFLLLAGSTHTFVISQWARIGSGDVHGVAFALIILGFGAKVGLVPFQVWLPAGYPRAPGPTRAAMAGLAVNAGFYGLWRFLGILGHPPVWLAAFVLVLGGITAVLGIAFAAVEPRLSRVIAYSSVENAGIILVGYGVALAGSATRNANLVAAGMLAASIQVLAHAVAKSTMFASSSFFESDYGTDELEDLRGLGRSHRWSASTFAVASVTLAGLPPTIGFVSEWLILESLMQEFRVAGLPLRLSMALAGALVALTTGIAALTFIRILGISVLGRPSDRAQRIATNHDGGLSGRAGMTVLGIACLGLAGFAPWVVRFVATGLSPIVGTAKVEAALKSPWVLQPVFKGFSILSPSWMFVAMPVGLASVLLMGLWLSRGRLFKVRRVPAWQSATAGVAGPDRYSAFGYANALRHVLGNILGVKRTAVLLDTEGAGSEPGVPHSGDKSTVHPRVEVQTVVVEPVEAYLYRPIRRAYLSLVRSAKLLQSGHLEAYIGYMLLALLVVLTVVAAMR